MTLEAQREIRRIERELWKGISRETDAFWRDCVTYLLNKLKHNRAERNKWYELYAEGRLSDNEFKRLLDDTDWYLGSSHRWEIWQNYQSQGLTPEEFHSQILKYAIPDIFTCQEILEGIGRDHSNHYDRQRFYRFFHQHRDAFTQCLEVLWNSDDYEQKKQEGYSDEDIYAMFVHRITRDNIYPMYALQHGYYRLLRLEDYAEAKTMRMSCIAHEVEDTKEEMMMVAERFPRLAELFQKPVARLKDTPFREMLPVANECPFCGDTFETEEELKEHLMMAHNAIP